MAVLEDLATNKQPLPKGILGAGRPVTNLQGRPALNNYKFKWTYIFTLIHHNHQPRQYNILNVLMLFFPSSFPPFLSGHTGKIIESFNQNVVQYIMYVNIGCSIKINVLNYTLTAYVSVYMKLVPNRLNIRWPDFKIPKCICICKLYSIYINVKKRNKMCTGKEFHSSFESYSNTILVIGKK